MDLLRLGFGAGMMFLGAVSAFMGTVMLIATLKSGEVRVDYGTSQQTIVASESPEDFRWAVGLAGVLPIVLGAAAIYGGRRVMRT